MFKILWSQVAAWNKNKDNDRIINIFTKQRQKGLKSKVQGAAIGHFASLQHHFFLAHLT